MALELRPNCEYCDIDLPPPSTEARICSYECTFCADCVAMRLHPTKRVHLSYSLDDITRHSERIRDIPPGHR